MTGTQSVPKPRRSPVPGGGLQGAAPRDWREPAWPLAWGPGSGHLCFRTGLLGRHPISGPEETSKHANWYSRISGCEVLAGSGRQGRGRAGTEQFRGFETQRNWLGLEEAQTWVSILALPSGLVL